MEAPFLCPLCADLLVWNVDAKRWLHFSGKVEQRMIKEMDDLGWWKRGRYDIWDDKESIWRNTNMIWIAAIAPLAIGIPAALLYQFLVGFR